MQTTSIHRKNIISDQTITAALSGIKSELKAGNDRANTDCSLKSIDYEQARAGMNERATRCINMLFSTKTVPNALPLRYSQWIAANNAAQAIATNQAAPLSDFEGEVRTTIPQRAAHHIVTNAANLEFQALFSDILEAGLIFGLESAADDIVLNSANPQCEGLRALAGLTQNETTSVHATITAGARQIRNACKDAPYSILANTAILDVETFERLQDETDGSGSLVVPIDAAIPMIRGVRVYCSTVLPPKSGIVLDSQAVTIARTPADAALRSTRSHENHFTRGLAVFMAESFIAPLLYARNAACNLVFN